MDKSLIITIYADSVPLSQVETIQQDLETVFEEYESKRITIQIQDQRLVREAS